MGCSWYLTINGSEISTGNQNCILEFFELLQKTDFHNEDRKYCSMTVYTMLERLTKIGYSTTSCEKYITRYKQDMKSRQESIGFRTKDLAYSAPDDNFWTFFAAVDLHFLSVLWKKKLSGENLSWDETRAFMLVTNSFDSEYIDPYFDQMVNYFVIASMFSADASFDFDFSEIVGWGYWGVEEFEVDSFDETLKSNCKREVFIRFSLYEGDPVQRKVREEYHERNYSVHELRIQRDGARGKPHRNNHA